MIPLSMSIAATVHVGALGGAGRMTEARSGGLTSIYMTLSSEIIVALILMMSRYEFVGFYSRDPDVISMAGQLLIFTMIFQILDAFAGPTQGVLRGYKDVNAALYLTALAYWAIAIPCGYILGLTSIIVPAMGVTGFWLALGFGLAVGGGLLFWRFLRISRQMLLVN